MNKEKQKKHMTFKYLKEIEESELDLANVEKVLGKNAWDDPGYEKIYLHLSKDYGWEGEAEQISIELLEKVIAKLKKIGANYMEIMYHTDHNGYVFHGLDVRKSTPEEVLSFQLNQDKKEKIRQEFEELEKKKNALNEEWMKL